MADEFPVPPDDASAKIDSYNQSQKRVVDTNRDLSKSQEEVARTTAIFAEETDIAREGLDKLGTFASKTGSYLNDFNNKLQAFSRSMNISGTLTDDQTKKFGLFTTAMVGARVEYQGLANVNLEGLNTFGEQLDSIVKLGGDSTTVIGKLADVAKNLGTIMPKEAQQSVEMAQGFVKNLLTSADNNARLRTTMLQLAAQTGQLGEIYKAAGSNMENMTSIVQDQDLAIQKAAESTSLGKDEVTKYFSQLAAIPGAMKDVVSSSTDGSQKISMLAATMKLATGAGRSFGDVQKDLASIYDQFNVRGEDALKFTARITELTNKFGPLGVQFKEVNKGMMETSSLFRNITDSGSAAAKMTEGVTSIMNDYIGALVKSGMTGAHAIDTVKGMTTAVSGLRIEQKAFLSAQTGGPGGLMGGYQIEKMLRDGDIKGVMDKVQQQMKKQLGSIVTLDEASKSDVAANQLTRQIQILKSGPLGSMVQSDQDAFKLLESFKAKEQGKEISDDLLKNPLLTGDSSNKGLMEQGTELQRKQLSVLTDIRSAIQGAQTIASGANASLVEGALGSSAGSSKVTDDSLRLQRDQRRANADNAGVIAANLSQRAASEIQARNVVDKNGEFAAKSINGFKSLASGFTDNLFGSISSIGSSLSDPLSETAKKSAQTIKQPSTTVGQAAQRTSDAGVKQNVGVVGSAVDITNPNMIRNDTNRAGIRLDVAAVCIHCRNQLEHSAHRDALNPASSAQSK